MKVQPKRMCIACRQEKDKKELIRIVKNADGEISIDKTSKKSGRGAYICDDENCIQKCIKTRALNRAFKMEIDQKIYDSLMEEWWKTTN